MARNLILTLTAAIFLSSGIPAQSQSELPEGNAKKAWRSP